MSAKTRERRPQNRARDTEPKARRSPGPSALDFRQVEGKVLTQLAIDNTPGDQMIILVFEDNTELCLSIDPGFTLTADYSAWKTGEQRVLRRWPPIRS